MINFRQLLAACVIGAACQPAVLPGRMITISDVECSPGAEVPVDVLLNDASDLAVISFQVNYDRTMLTLASVTNFAGTLGGEFAMAFETLDGVLVVYLYRHEQLLAGTGKLATMVFTANEGAINGMESDLVLAEAGLADQYGGDLAWGAAIVPHNGKIVINSAPGVTNHLLLWQASPGGGVSGSPGGYYPSTSIVAVTAQAEPYYHFAGWSGNTVGNTNDPSMAAGMEIDRVLTANFEADVTTNTATPLWWLVQYGLTNQSFEQTVLIDSDLDGLSNWEEYISGTRPDDPTDRLECSEFRRAGSNSSDVVLNWLSVSNRIYDVRYMSNLYAEPIVLTNSVNATPPMNTYTTPLNGIRSGFFQIRVR